MSVKQAWEELLRLRGQDFIGGDIEHIEDPEGAFRGPITSISIEDDTLW